MMEYRNARFVADGRIDCEINHPAYGWIPFTANPTDAGSLFDVAALHAQMSVDPATQPHVAPPPAVPFSVTPRQVRLLLLQQGLLDSVKALIAQQDEATQIAWEFASDFRRDDPLLNNLAQTLGLTQLQVDQFFIEASSL